MALDLCIRYKDPFRPESWYPFSLQSVLIKHWWPLARTQGLEMLQRLECLFIQDRAEAEQLIREFRFVETLLKSPDHGGVPEGVARDMLDTLATLLPLLDVALAEWDNVKELSL